MAAADLFLSYSRGDDEPFVARLYHDLTAKGWKVWWDRECMPSRGLKFTQEIRDAIEACDRLLLVVGPRAVASDYVRAAWEHALLFAKGVVPILRLGDYSLLPPDLRSLHCPDFRRQSWRGYRRARKELLRLLAEPVADLAPLLTAVPALPPHFLPRRADLERLVGAVLADVQCPMVITSARQTAALHGMGGIGKTVMAVALARAAETRRACLEGVLWLMAGREADAAVVRQNITRALTALKVAAESSEDQPALEDRLRQTLDGKACLLVLDDVWDLEQARPFAKVLGPRCRLLVTTRDRSLVTAMGAQEHSVEVLGRDEALERLAEWSGQVREALPSEAEGVVRECGGLPLALALAGAQVRDKRPWGDLLAALRAAELDYLDHPYGSVMRSMKVSVEALAETDRARYLELAVLPEDEVAPEAVVLRLWEWTGGLSERQSRSLLASLHNKALLRLQDGGPTRKIALHDLQHDYLRAAAGEGMKGLHERLLEAYGAGCGGEWRKGPDDCYFFEHLARHLAQAGRLKELEDLLFDYRWLEAKLRAAGVGRVIRAYDWLPAEPAAWLAASALVVSGHVIREDPRQLAGQLAGRLSCGEDPRLDQLLKSSVTAGPRPWLRPRKATLAGGPLLSTLKGHSDWVHGVAVTPDGQRAVSASWDHTLKVWGGHALRTLEGHSDRVYSVAVTPDGQRAVSASGDHTLKVWDLASGRALRTLEGHSDRVYSVAVTPDGQRAVSASGDHTLKVWDLASGRALRRLEGHSAGVNGVAVTPDGQRTVSASADHTLKMWDLASGRTLRTLEGHSDGVLGVAVTPDGQRAVSASADHTLKVWDLARGRALRALEGHSAGVNGVAVTPDGGRTVSASGDHTLKVWDLAGGRALRPLGGHSAGVNGVAVTPDGQRAVSASSDETLKVWDLASGRTLRLLAGHSDGVLGVAVTPDGQRAVSASGDHTLKVWDLASGRTLRTLEGHSDGVLGVTVTPDGQRAVSASGDHTLKVWDLASGRTLRTLEGHSAGVNGVAVTPDGQRAVSASGDHTLKVWDLASGRTLRTLEGHSAGVNGVTVTPDGQQAVSASWDHTLKVWALESGRRLRPLEGPADGVLGVAVTPDGQRAVSSSGDHTLKVWDLGTGRCLATFTADASIRACAVAPDGRTFVAGDEMGCVHILELLE